MITHTNIQDKWKTSSSSQWYTGINYECIMVIALYTNVFEGTM